MIERECWEAMAHQHSLSGDMIVSCCVYVAEALLIDWHWAKLLVLAAVNSVSKVRSWLVTTLANGCERNLVMCCRGGRDQVLVEGADVQLRAVREGVLYLTSGQYATELKEAWREKMATRSLPTIAAGSGGLSRYLEEIRRFPMLEPNEEYMLARS